MLTLQDQVNIIFIGALGETEQLAAVGLGNMIMCMLASTFIYGINTALETFVSQAFGRRNLRECALYMHRAIFLNTIVFVPITLILL